MRSVPRGRPPRICIGMILVGGWQILFISLRSQRWTFLSLYLPQMVLKINGIFEARRGKKRMKRVSQSTESSSGRGEASHVTAGQRKDSFTCFTSAMNLLRVGIFVLSTSAAPPSGRLWGFLCLFVLLVSRICPTLVN